MRRQQGRTSSYLDDYVEYTEADYLREVQLGLRRLSKRVARLDKRLERVA